MIQCIRVVGNPGLVHGFPSVTFGLSIPATWCLVWRCFHDTRVHASRYSEVSGFRLHRSESGHFQVLVSGCFSDGPAEDGFMTCTRFGFRAFSVHFPAKRLCALCLVFVSARDCHSFAFPLHVHGALALIAGCSRMCRTRSFVLLTFFLVPGLTGACCYLLSSLGVSSMPSTRLTVFPNS